jgi:hypothetical protein
LNHGEDKNAGRKRGRRRLTDANQTFLDAALGVCRTAMKNKRQAAGARGAAGKSLWFAGLLC